MYIIYIYHDLTALQLILGCVHLNDSGNGVVLHNSRVILKQTEIDCADVIGNALYFF